MCLIAYRPVGGKSGRKRGGNLPHAVCDSALSRNPDGFGIAWRDPDSGRVTIDKFAPAERKAFRARLRTVDRDQRIEYAAHFRYATGGPEDRDHAHPYMYEDAAEGTVAVFHNGVIDIYSTTKESDTEVFVRDVLAYLPSRWWTDAALRALVLMAIGGSKLLIMTDRETAIIGEKRGEWDGGMWYSSYHRPYKASATLTSKGMTSADWKVYAEAKWGVAASQVASSHKSARESAATLALLPGPKADRDRTIVMCDHGVMLTEACLLCDPEAATYGETCEHGKAWRDECETCDATEAHGASYTRITRDGEVKSDRATIVKGPGDEFQFRHLGHTLTAITSIDRFGGDADYPASVVCDSCYTTGDVYVIDGGVYIDMAHRSPAASDEADDEEARYVATYAVATPSLICDGVA